MVCLGLEPGAAGWLAQTNPLSYGSTPTKSNLIEFLLRVLDKKSDTHVDSKQ